MRLCRLCLGLAVQCRYTERDDALLVDAILSVILTTLLHDDVGIEQPLWKRYFHG